MSNELLALIVGTVLAVGALAFVLHPLFFPAADTASRSTAPTGSEDSPIVALREIEFDRATGKLSESDYAELKSTYSARALAEMRNAEQTPAAEALDPVEARVRAYRRAHKECPTCGLRPEPDAIYCSSCGIFLDKSCPSCKASITEPSAAFCSTCGVTLNRPRAIA